MKDTDLAEPVAVVAEVAAALDQLRIPHAVVGSLASSMHGIPRATQDADLVAALETRHAAPLRDALRERFYMDRRTIEEAVGQRDSFNVIHMSTMFKVDIFVSDGSPWVRSELERAVPFDIGPSGATCVRFATPEDVLLHKLLWFRDGGEVPDRQWSDVLGILRIQASELDHEYLDLWARVLEVKALLDRARASGGRPTSHD